MYIFHFTLKYVFTFVHTHVGNLCLGLLRERKTEDESGAKLGFYYYIFKRD